MWCSGQFNVLSEPFLDLYKQSSRSPDDHQIVMAEIRALCDALLNAEETQPIFVKEMGYHAEAFVTDSFLRAVNNTFLIRDPSLSIPSLYKMRADYAEAQAGFEGQLRLLRRVAKLTGESPLVFDGEDLRTSAEPLVRQFFAHIGEDMPPNILRWPAGSREEWADRESWHTHAISSEGFETTVSETNLPELPERVVRSIERNRPHYDELKRYVSEQTT